MKICSVLLVLWYLMSVIGFNVHTCHGEGHSFVTTFIEGTACSDIHPDHHCTDTHHHSDEAEGCCGSDDQDDCCSDEFQVLSVTGLMSDDNYACSCESSLIDCLYIAHSSSALEQVYLNDYLLKDLYEPESGLAAGYDVQSFFSIWRI